MLTHPQIEQFHREGWCVVPRFFSVREVEAMRAEMEALRASGLIGNVATAGDGRTEATDKVNLQICPLWKKSRFFSALPFHAPVVEAVAALLGHPVMFRLDQIFLKPARKGMGTSWHQDNFYFKLPEPHRGTGMWIALHDATAANGTMRIVPGANQPSMPHHRDLDSNHHSRCFPDESRALTIEVPAGGVLFFDYNVPHCTGPNTTDRDRAGLALHFYSGATDPGDMTVNADSHAALSGPRATGGVAERGEDLRNVWSSLVEERLANLA
jgi:ectoine hydroxylase-related dioxygenase (phytanoyl-CoA dioxygenase family)